MTDQMIVILGLALGTYAIRLGGYLIGAQLPDTGRWARAFNALPGCLIASLLAVMIVPAGPAEWMAAALALIVAMISRNLPLTMVTGILAVLVLRGML